MTLSQWSLYPIQASNLKILVPICSAFHIIINALCSTFQTSDILVENILTCYNDTNIFGPKKMDIIIALKCLSGSKLFLIKIFFRLKELIPSVSAKDNVTQLDIILEAIRYIDSLQHRLADKIENGDLELVQVKQ